MEENILTGTAGIYLQDDPQGRGAVQITEVKETGPNTYLLGFEGLGPVIVDERAEPNRIIWNANTGRLEFVDEDWVEAFNQPADFKVEFDKSGANWEVRKITLSEPTQPPTDQLLFLALLGFGPQPNYDVEWETFQRVRKDTIAYVALIK